MSTTVLKPDQHCPTDPPAVSSMVLCCSVVQDVTFLLSDKKHESAVFCQILVFYFMQRMVIILQLTGIAERRALKPS